MENPPCPRPRDRAEFEIAIICALSLEANAVEAMFDDLWEGDASYGKAAGDPNAYTTGRIGRHNVVLAYMPRMGKVQAASVAAHLRASFSGVKLVLVTGICGGVPETVKQLEGREMLLGDVVISTAVVQFDLARQFPDKTITKNTLEDALGRPNHEISAMLQKIQVPRRRQQLEQQIAENLDTLYDKDEFTTSRYPGSSHDVLYPPDYRHKHHDPHACDVCGRCEDDNDEVCNAALESTCFELKCDEMRKCSRQRLSRTNLSGSPKPEIYLGRIASGDQVMKSGRHRAIVAAEHKIIAFEMEAAGVWDNLPTIVMKGICDYADSHKNKKWQRYAAASAAACTKAFLGEWTTGDKSLQALPIENVYFRLPQAPNPCFTGRLDLIEKISTAVSPQERPSTEQQKTFVITGLGGQGKSELCIKVANTLRHRFWGVFWVDVSTSEVAEKDFINIAKTIGAPTESPDEARQVLASSTKTWLLILDNADDINVDYHGYFPPGTNGAILLTARLKECARYATVGTHWLEGLDIKLATQLLLKTAQISPDDWVPHTQHAEAIVYLLGSHTLALTQAGAYVAGGNCSLQQYPSIFDQQRTRLLQFKPRQAKSRYGDIYATFEASAILLEKSDTRTAGDAVELLHFLSMFHWSWLPPEIFVEAWSCSVSLLSKGDEDSQRENDPEALSRWPRKRVFRKSKPRTARTFHFRSIQNSHRRSDAPIEEPAMDFATKEHVELLPRLIDTRNEEWDPTRLNEASALLASLSLVTLNESSQLSMHPLTHAWARDRQTPDQQWNSWLSAGSIIALSDENNGPWSRLQTHLRPHLFSFLDSHFSPAMATLRGSQEVVVPIFLRCAYYMCIMREKPHFHRLLDEIFAATGIDREIPLRRSMRLHQLKSWCLRDEGELDKAAALTKRLIQIAEMMKDQEQVIEFQHDLSSIHQENGQIDEAVQLLIQVVQFREKLYSADDPTLLSPQHELARAYLGNGEVQRAVELSENVVNRQKSVLKADHPDLLTSQHVLARAYLKSGEVERAVELFEHVVNREKSVLKADHPDLFTSQHELARSYEASGQQKAAIELMTHVVNIRRKTLSETHEYRLWSEEALQDWHAKYPDLIS